MFAQRVFRMDTRMSMMRKKEKKRDSSQDREEQTQRWWRRLPGCRSSNLCLNNIYPEKWTFLGHSSSSCDCFDCSWNTEQSSENSEPTAECINMMGRNWWMRQRMDRQKSTIVDLKAEPVLQKESIQNIGKAFFLQLMLEDDALVKLSFFGILMLSAKLFALEKHSFSGIFCHFISASNFIRQSRYSHHWSRQISWHKKWKWKDY